MLHIGTDGSCRDGVGGWAAVGVSGNDRWAVEGRVEKTTNQRMEVTAAIQGLAHTTKGSQVTLYSDSQYLVHTMTRNWKRRANLDLWQRLDELVQERQVNWVWDSNHPLVHEAHQLAERIAGIIPQAPGEKPSIQMVDVGEKAITQREAIARGIVRMKPATLELILKGGLAKGDVLGVAQVAGIMAAKQTPYLIPLCHPLLTEVVEVQVTPQPGQGGVEISARVRGEAKTGMEMEALTAVAGAALTVYDMCKGVDPAMTIEVSLVKKSGGRSGTVTIEHSGGIER